MQIVVIFVVAFCVAVGLWKALDTVNCDKYIKYDYIFEEVQRCSLIAAGISAGAIVICLACLLHINYYNEYKLVELTQQRDSILAEMTESPTSSHLYGRISDWNTLILQNQMHRSSLFKDFYFPAYDEFDIIDLNI